MVTPSEQQRIRAFIQLIDWFIFKLCKLRGWLVDKTLSRRKSEINNLTIVKKTIIPPSLFGKYRMLYRFAKDTHLEGKINQSLKQTDFFDVYPEENNETIY